MLTGRRPHRLAVPAVSLAMLACPSLVPAEEVASGRAPAPPAQAYAIHIANKATAHTLQLALDGARARLGAPQCQGVLDDFRDAAGRVLREALEATGQSPEGYLSFIVFFDGQSNLRCRRKGILAVSAPGSRAVYICPETFATMTHRNRTWVEATLIHETLHTLGLGENPPSSVEITERVMQRCTP